MQSTIHSGGFKVDVKSIWTSVRPRSPQHPTQTPWPHTTLHTGTDEPHLHQHSGLVHSLAHSLCASAALRAAAAPTAPTLLALAAAAVLQPLTTEDGKGR